MLPFCVSSLDSERLRGFCDRRTDVQTDGQMDICDSRVAFATENLVLVSFGEERNCGSFVLLQF